MACRQQACLSRHLTVSEVFVALPLTFGVGIPIIILITVSTKKTGLEFVEVPWSLAGAYAGFCPEFGRTV